ncbi:50S ribosomal protein L30 [Candidatus Woesearchaeota archaeon]|nr:50S ribosomal protein L30 [Candidatus Woesearchaeota archaeon]
MSEEKSAKGKGESEELIALILVRGMINVKQGIKDTLKMLRLHRKNCCVVIKKTPANMGMVQKVKDYITWGEIDEATLKEMIDRRGKKNPKDPKKTKPFFRLNPPKKGFGSKGIKKTFAEKGALGYRGDKINDLIKRML